MTKSLQSTIMGMLVKDGVLTVNSTFGNVIPQWQSDGVRSVYPALFLISSLLTSWYYMQRANITLHNLLKMESGLAFREVYAPVGSDVVPMLFNQYGLITVALSKHLEHTPGTQWYYSSGTSNILSWITRKLAKSDQDYWTFPAHRLFDSA